MMTDAQRMERRSRIERELRLRKVNMAIFGCRNSDLRGIDSWPTESGEVACAQCGRKWANIHEWRDDFTHV